MAIVPVVGSLALLPPKLGSLKPGNHSYFKSYEAGVDGPKVAEFDPFYALFIHIGF